MRDSRGRYLPGQSGNPGGRPARSIPAELGLAALTHAIEALILVIRDPRTRPADRLRAAEQLLRRVAGRTGRVRGAAELALSWGLVPPEPRPGRPPDPPENRGSQPCRPIGPPLAFRIREP